MHTGQYSKGGRTAAPVIRAAEIGPIIFQALVLLNVPWAPTPRTVERRRPRARSRIKPAQAMEVAHFFSHHSKCLLSGFTWFLPLRISSSRDRDATKVVEATSEAAPVSVCEASLEMRRSCSRLRRVYRFYASFKMVSALDTGSRTKRHRSRSSPLTNPSGQNKHFSTSLGATEKGSWLVFGTR